MIDEVIRFYLLYTTMRNLEWVNKIKEDKKMVTHEYKDKYKDNIIEKCNTNKDGAVSVDS